MACVGYRLIVWGYDEVTQGKADCKEYKLTQPVDDETKGTVWVVYQGMY